MTQEGRILRNEEIYDLYSTNIIRVMKSRRIKWERHVACMGERNNADTVLVRQPGERRPLGKPRRR